MHCFVYSVALIGPGVVVPAAVKGSAISDKRRFRNPAANAAKLYGIARTYNESFNVTKEVVQEFPDAPINSSLENY
ncbi:hypothetical protein IWQ61_009592, partial [Dispira simplex]